MTNNKKDYYQMELDDMVAALEFKDETIDRMKRKLETCISGLIQIQKTEPADPADAYGTVQAIHFIASKTISDIVDTVISTPNQKENENEKQN